MWNLKRKCTNDLIYKTDRLTDLAREFGSGVYWMTSKQVPKAHVAWRGSAHFHYLYLLQGHPLSKPQAVA